MRTFVALESLVAHPLVGRNVAMQEGEPVSHPAFRDRVAMWHAAFIARRGTRWAFYFDDALTFAAALFGAWLAGRSVYLCSDNLPATLEALREGVDGYVGDVDDAFHPLQPHAGATAPAVWPSLDAERAAVFVQTSGSTGSPVLIAKRLRQLAEEVAALEHRFAGYCEATVPTSQVVVHGTVSHQHIYGLLFRVLWPLASGRPFTARLFRHSELAQALGEGDGVLVSSPAHLKRLPVDLDWSGARNCLRAAFSSGGPLDDEAAFHAQAVLGVAPIEVLGSSETGGIASRRRAVDDAASHIWQPLPGVEWRIEADRLEVKSPFLADAQWLRTDDRAQRDGENGFRLMGRGDRVVKIEERRVSLTALEAALAGHPLVQEVRVLTQEDDANALAAVVVPTAEGWQQLEALGRWRFAQSLRTALAAVVDATLHPTRWRYVSALPLNAQGKVTQRLLQSLFHAAPEPRAAPVRPHESLTKDPR